MKLTLTDLERDLSRSLPLHLVKLLLNSYKKIKENFYLGKLEPAELDGGKLCEVVLRILQVETQQHTTPFSTHVRDLAGEFRKFENMTSANESIRFHIPRLASALYNIRNKRGVGHAGQDVNPNLADSTIVAASADWIIAEFIRLHYSCTLDEAQATVDSLVQRRLPLVYEILGVKRVLNPKLSAAERSLLILASQPEGLSESELFKFVEHSNRAVFRRDVLKTLHKRKQIEFDGRRCTILPPGLRVVEEHYDGWSKY
nr:hypothetical protein [Ferrimicrobium acidiphilum]